MKHLKRILSIFLVLAVFVGSFIGSFSLFEQGTYDFDVKDLAIFDEKPSCYYLQKADKNIAFRVCCDTDSVFGYSLKNDEDVSIQTKTQKTSPNCYDILPHENGYEAGKKYTLSLPKGVTFESDDLKAARTLVFSIDKEAVETYEFTDAVVEIDTVVGDVIDSKLDVKNLNVNAGDILLGQDKNNEYVVYKVSEISENGTAIVSDPAIDEIYSDLEVYGEYI